MKLHYVLHFYQPDFQFKEVLEEVYKNSYKPIFEIVKNSANAKLNINITASTIEQFNKYQVGNLQEDLKELYRLGKVSFLATSLSHALLSHISKKQAIRQIKVNNAKLSYYLGIPEEEFNILYPPELSVNKQVLSIAKGLNLKGVIIPHSTINNFNERENKYQINGVKTLIRSLKLSRILESPSIHTFGEFKETLEKNNIEDLTYVVVHDAEVIGYAIHEKIELFRDLFQSGDFEFGLLSDEIRGKFLKHLTSINQATWEKMLIHGELIDPHWKNKNNNIHKYQWKLTQLIVDFIEDIKDEELKYELQNHLDYSLYSCQYWWASSYPFWSPGIISHSSWNWFYLAHRSYLKAMPESPEKSKKFLAAAERAYLGVIRSTADYDITKWHEKNIKYYDDYIHPLKLNFQL